MLVSLTLCTLHYTNTLCLGALWFFEKFKGFLGFFKRSNLLSSLTYPNILLLDMRQHLS